MQLTIRKHTSQNTLKKKMPPKAAFRGRIVKAVLLAFAKKPFRNTNFIFLKQVSAAFRLFSLWNLADLIHLWDGFFQRSTSFLALVISFSAVTTSKGNVAFITLLLLKFF